MFDKLYVVSQFASAANRRILHWLRLDEVGVETVLVKQDFHDHGRAIRHSETVSVKKPPNPLRALDLVGLVGARTRLEEIIYFPTPGILFARAALATLDWKLRRDFTAGRHPAVALIAPPHDLVTLASPLRRRFAKVRIVIDWQDLWTDDDTYAGRTASARHWRLRLAECRAAEAADVNIVTNPIAAARFSRILWRQGANGPHVRAIEHAFDEEDVATARQHAVRRVRSDAPVLAFYGNLFKPPKVPGSALISHLCSAHQAGCRFELSVVGDKIIERDPHRLGLLPFPTVIRPRVTHLEAVADAVRADWLLLLLGRTEGSGAIMHAKLPMYLATGRPILAFVPKDSFVASVITETRAGVVIDLDDNPLEKLVQTLMGPPPGRANEAEMVARWKSFGLTRMHRLMREAIGHEPAEACG